MATRDKKRLAETPTRSIAIFGVRETIAVLLTAFFTALIALVLFSAFANSYKKDILSTLEEKISKESVDTSDVAAKSSCNTQSISLRGTLTEDVAVSEEPYYVESGSPDICEQIVRADQDEMIQAIIMEVNSPGGNPFAAEEIEGCIKRADKPVIAYIRDAGTSAAYWSITSADKIYASALSRVGSIGVYISYLDDVKRNEREGQKYHLYSTGKFKDILSPDKPVTKEEEELIMEELRNAHNIFVKTIAENRHISVETLAQISDGRVFNGEQATLIGLIDHVGGLYEVKNYIKEKYLDGTEAIVCE